MFWRSVGVVLTGSAMAQAIPLLGSLLIARLYAPQEFGLFAAWLGAASMLAVALTFRYEMALALEGDGEPRRTGATAVLCAVLLGTLVTSLLLGLCFALNLVNIPHARLWLTVPAAAALMAVAQTWQAWAAADGSYRRLSLMRITQAACVTGAQILCGLAAPDAFSLAMAHLGGVACGVAIAFWQLPLAWKSFRGLGWSDGALAFCRRHRRMPLLSLPADLVNAAVSQLPLLIVTSRFGADVGGWLALTLRMLGGPISLLGAAVLDVFRRQAAQSFRERGECRAEYVRTFKVLGAASLVFVLILTPFSETLFRFGFGERWVAAGTIATWLLPLFAMRFVASPLSYMFYVADKQHVDLVWQLTLLGVTLASLLLPADYASALQLYSLGYSAMYVAYLFLSYRFSLGRPT